MNTGILREVLAWYSAYGGNASTESAQTRSRSASSWTSRTRMVWTSVASRISTSTSLRRLYTHTGFVGAPPWEATST